MLNFPKTGSSYARAIIKNAYINRHPLSHRLATKIGIIPSPIKDIKSLKIDEEINYNISDQHGTYRQIPNEHTNKKIVSITRNPISRYKSAYLYRWWVKHPPAHISTIKKDFPKFPDISFEEYLNLVHLYGRKNRLKELKTKTSLGLHTIQFIQFYFKNPEATLEKIDDNYIDQEEFWNDVAPIDFLRQENLREDIKCLLHRHGFSESETSFINSSKRVNATKSKKKIELNTSKEQLSLILEREKLIFKIFPEYLL